MDTQEFNHPAWIKDLIFKANLPVVPHFMYMYRLFKFKEEIAGEMKFLEKMVFVSLDEMFPFRNSLPSPCSMVKIMDLS